MKTNSLNQLESASDGVPMRGANLLSRGRAGHGRSWQGGLVLALAVAVQACGGGGSGGSSDAKTDASPSVKDAAADAGVDSGTSSSRDTAFIVDGVSTDIAEGPTDTAKQDAPAGSDLGVVDVLGQDAGVASLDNARDVPNGSLIDMAVDQEIATLDGSAEAGPAGGAFDAATVDMGDEVSASSFSCGSLETRDSGAIQQLCYDFSDPASAADFTPEAGTWVVSNGSYNASGPPVQVTCSDGGSGMTASVLSDLSAQDVRVHAKITSVMGPDMVLVLRSRPGGNRIELNFVANYIDQGEAQGGALNISEMVDCVNATYLAGNASTGRVEIPHAIGQAIVIDVQLIGTRLTVAMDGNQIFDNTLPVSTAAGSVGFAVFRNAQMQFDDFLVEVLK